MVGVQVEGVDVGDGVGAQWERPPRAVLVLPHPALGVAVPQGQVHLRRGGGQGVGEGGNWPAATKGRGGAGRCIEGKGGKGQAQGRGRCRQALEG